MATNEIFRSFDDIQCISNQIRKEANPDRNYRIMEVCGTHTMSIAKYGISSILPDNVKLLSGPGCPVCVTSEKDIDFALGVSEEPNVVIACFGDFLKVSGSIGTSLYSQKTFGYDIRVIYSPLDILKMAVKEPRKRFILLGLGFETTAPLYAAYIKLAYEYNLSNVFLFSILKTMPRALETVISIHKDAIDGFICPGNVTAITGEQTYECVINNNKAAVISGFEPTEILSSILICIRQINNGDFSIHNNYSYIAKKQGNSKALSMINDVFEPCDSDWRGFGLLSNSGLEIKDQFESYNAGIHFKTNSTLTYSSSLCLCGDIIAGLSSPLDCPLFSSNCNPLNPKGPCMVSREGNCFVHYTYGGRTHAAGE